MRANGSLAGVEFIAPPAYHPQDEIWREIITESGYWFTKSALKWFGSRVVWDSLVKLNAADYLFISSEQSSGGAWNGRRRYTVRQWNTVTGVNGLSEFGQFATLAAARKWATSAGWERAE
jgi:hypothetical protein